MGKIVSVIRNSVLPLFAVAQLQKSKAISYNFMAFIFGCNPT